MAYEPALADGQQIELDPVSRVAGALALHGVAGAGGQVRDAAVSAGTYRVIRTRSRSSRTTSSGSWPPGSPSCRC